MSTSPERCLGGLIKDIDKEIPVEELNIESKDTICPESIEQKYSFDMINSYNSISSTIPSSSCDSKNININMNVPIPSVMPNSFIINKFKILSAFDNQNDTIYLKKMVKGASKEVLYQIINELKGIFSIIIKNKNGNYFCSDLFKACDKNLRLIILKELSLTLSEDCLNEYGTHSFQVLIEKSSCEEEYNLILSSFKEYDKILKAAINSNGFYVIQKIIIHIPERFRMEFNYLFLKLFYNLSVDVYGISTVKTFIIYTKNEEIMNQIWTITYNNFLNIAKNQYGNYLIQCMLENWGDSKIGINLKKLCIAYFPEMMENHYSKFICDLFINRANIEEKKIVLATLLKRNNNTDFNNIKNASNKRKNNFNINNKKYVNNQINNNKINFPLSNKANPFYPKKNKNMKEE